MKKYTLIIGLVCFFFPHHALSRDINLDSIYIKKNSPYHSKLMASKLDAYAVAASRFIVRDVIFADWLNGHEIIYIRELPETNIIGSYHLDRQGHREIARIHGTVTASVLSLDGRYLYLKILTIGKQPVPANSRIVFNVVNGSMKSEKAPFPFLDFTLSPTGGILVESGRGIIEYFPDSESSKVILQKKEYTSLFDGNNPIMLHQAPNKKNSLIISGSGGQYSAFIFSAKNRKKIDDITSATELFWINNNELLYRSGYTGEYSITLYNILKGKKETIISGSLNTNLHAPHHGGPVSLLLNQVITLYTPLDRSLFMTGLEGEDVRFSPDGSHFVSLLYKKLFLSRTESSRIRNRELISNSENLISLYRTINSDSSQWENEYTGQYIGKKIGTYTMFIKSKY